MNDIVTTEDILGAARAGYQEVEAARQLAKSAEESARSKLLQIVLTLGEKLEGKTIVISGTPYMQEIHSKDGYYPGLSRTSLVDRKAHVLRTKTIGGATIDDGSEPGIECVFEKHRLEGKDGGWFLIRLSAITKLEIVEPEAPQP